MDVTVDQATGRVVEKPAGLTASTTSVRMDWILTILSVWLVGGFYIDLWAHNHDRVDDTFFTPWHAIMYTGAAAFGVVLVGAAMLGRPRSVPLRETLAPPYRLAFAGFVLFVVAGLLDLAWHAVFGFEVDVEALLSPTHLLLATGGLLMVGGPLRAAGARLLEGVHRSWRTAGPVAIPMAMAVAILVAFTQYVNPVVDTWSGALPADEPPPTAQLYAMNANGSGQRRLTVVPGEAVSADWSPDGSQIAYAFTPLADGDAEVRSQIHVMAVDGSDDRVLATEHGAIDPAWSPDGTRIAFAQNIDDLFALSLMNADGSAIEQLTDGKARDWGATWTRDGSALVFNSDREGSNHLYRLDLASREVTQLTSGPSSDWEPALSPDGTRVAFTSNRRETGTYDVWIANIDGSEPTRLTVGDDVGDSYMPSWSPDGESIAFTSNRTGDFEVYSMPAAGGEATNLTQNPGASDGWARAQWSPDGSTIVYPSEGNLPFWREPYVRQGFGAAGILVGATILAGAIIYLRRRYGTLPLGAYAVVIAAPLALATVMRDEYRLLPAIVSGGLLAELIVRRWPAGRSRLGDAVVAFLVPAGVFALYFLTIGMTDGLGWTIHLWLGAIATAGIIGLFLDELSRAHEPAPARNVPGG